jgi:hypothetical protein
MTYHHDLAVSFVALLGTVQGCCCCIPGGVLWSSVAVLFLTAGALIYLRALWQSRYDPNSLPADYRIKWGGGLAVSKADFLKLLQRPPASAAQD